MLKPVNVKLNTKNYSHFAAQYFRSFILLLLSFSFIILSSVTAQVKIKEKVEIKPSTSLTKGLNQMINNIYFPCGTFISSNDTANPWQVVYGRNAWNLYQDVKNGNLPNGWK